MYFINPSKINLILKINLNDLIMDAKHLLSNKLLIGWAQENITPLGEAILYGQFYDRVSQYVQSPITVTAFAIESVGENGEKDQCIMVSMDLTECWTGMQEVLRRMVKDVIPDFDITKIFLNATHTHSAPDANVNSEYGKLVLDKIAIAVVSAWNARTEGGVSWALGYAAIGHNRRVRYADGTAEMYGAPNRQDFIGIEGPADQGVNMLFCWDKNKELTGIIMNVPCPAQVTEAKYYISADYWGEVRKQLKDEFSKKIYVLAQCGAAGDLSPRDLPRRYKGGEPNMWDTPGINEIGRRLSKIVMDSIPIAKENIQNIVAFKHETKNISIPTLKISEEEYQQALRILNDIQKREPNNGNSSQTAWNRFLKEIKDNEKARDYGPWDNKNSDYGVLKIKESVIKQYKYQKEHPFYEMELHVIRIGEVVMASNSFELFVNYGFQIMGRSKADQTFLIQLSSDYANYLPTEIALKGGGYSAEGNLVGPDGGKVLVEETLVLINNMWA